MKNRLIVGSIVALLLLAILCLLIFDGYSSARFVDGDVIYVDDNGVNRAGYDSIQDAINAADEGDTVYVYSGIYYENIVIDKIINLVGEDKTTTIIDGGGHGDVVSFSPLSDWVNLTGFTIQNSGSEEYDAGVDINSNYNTIAGNIIRDCNQGISLGLWGHNCRIYNNVLKNNIYGIVVYSVIPNNNIIHHNNFIGNSVNAYDDSNSTWMHLGEGNYWDDYTGEDDDGDGIGDTPYDIPGGCARDVYPLMEPYETPGFEFILALISIVVLLFLLRKKWRIVK